MLKTLFLIVPGAVAVLGLQQPYSVPTFASLSSDTWPSNSEWVSLNDSLGGRLQALRPWAAVCYTSDPLYNEEDCQLVLSGYTTDTKREAVPAALLWQNWESCGFGRGCGLNASNPQPIDNATCHQGTTPPYSVSIRDAQDASTVVSWATAHHVKITVKNTGHDYLGRSAAPSTLQVDTHLIDDLTYVAEFVPQGSDAAPVTALTVGAGAQIYNIYRYAAAQNITPIIGACLTVGAAGGFIQGGGHSPLSPAYGLGADNALEYEVVTADGQVRVANEAQNSDLFWALRGGGAGSWGIITSVTIRVYPQVSIGASVLSIVPNATQNTTALGIEFISLVAKYQNKWINSGIASADILFRDQYLVSIFWPTNAADLSLLYPFFEELKSLSSSYTVSSNTTSGAMFPSISVAVEQNIGPLFDSLDTYGAANHFASRFVPQSSIDPSNPGSITTVSEAIWSGLEIANRPFGSKEDGLLSTEVPVTIFGSLPAATAGLVNETGTNPGMYSAAWHVVYAVQWTLGLNESATSALRTAIHDSVLPLNALGFTSSYQNEGDPFEENWQHVFFGYKYADLLTIKQKYDPHNFFTSYKGVASVTTLDAYRCYN